MRCSTKNFLRCAARNEKKGKKGRGLKRRGLHRLSKRNTEVPKALAEGGCWERPKAFATEEGAEPKLGIPILVPY